MQPSLVLPLGVSLAAAALAAGCDATAPGACSSEFRTITVTVVDSGSVPVSDVVIRSTLLRTGEVLSATTLALQTPGTYVIVDDGARMKLLSSGDSVGVSVQPDSGTGLEAYYVIAVPNACHVVKVSGPDTLNLP